MFVVTIVLTMAVDIASGGVKQWEVDSQQVKGAQLSVKSQHVPH